jgi:O-antigen ligase
MLPALLVAGVAALGALQSLAWPPAVVEILAPRLAELYRQAGELVGERLPAALSLAPSASRSAALGWLAAAAVLWAAAVVGRRRSHRTLLAAAVGVAAGIQVLYGLRRWAVGANSIWGAPVPRDAGRLRGTFVNPDHLAAFLTVALAVAFAAGWWALRRARRGMPLERALLVAAPPALAWVAIFACLAFTGSRAGLAAAVVATAVQGALAAVAGGRRRLAPVGVVVALVGLGVVAVVGLEQGLGRLLATTPFEVAWTSRLAVYRATVSLWLQYPLTGTGLGTFAEAFPTVQPATAGGGWEHAHNDYLELLATGGVVAAALAAAAALVVVVRLARGLGEGRPSEDRAAALAALGAVAGLAVHEAFDFGLVLPANALVLAMVVGAALGTPEHPPPGVRR